MGRWKSTDILAIPFTDFSSLDFLLVGVDYLNNVLHLSTVTPLHVEYLKRQL